MESRAGGDVVNAQHKGRVRVTVQQARLMCIGQPHHRMEGCGMLPFAVVDGRDADGGWHAAGCSGRVGAGMG
jgi:hypothetical protein